MTAIIFIVNGLKVLGQRFGFISKLAFKPNEYLKIYLCFYLVSKLFIIKKQNKYKMNDFQILSKLGEGAYSVVHKARRQVDGNIYALKQVKLLNLSEKEKLNALNEVRILASVKSNYVISYKEAFYDEKENILG